MDRLTEAFFKVKKAINNVSLPEAKLYLENMALISLDIYSNPDMINRAIEKAKAIKFLNENIGKEIEITGTVNRLYRDSKEIELFQITINQEYYEEWGGIAVLTKTPYLMAQGDIISVTGILKDKRVLSCSSLRRVKPSEEEILSRELSTLKGSINFWKGEISLVKKRLKGGVTQKGKPYTENYLRYLKGQIICYEDELREKQGEMMSVDRKIELTPHRHLKLTPL